MRWGGGGLRKAARAWIRRARAQRAPDLLAAGAPGSRRCQRPCLWRQGTHRSGDRGKHSLRDIEPAPDGDRWRCTMPLPGILIGTRLVALAVLVAIGFAKAATSLALVAIVGAAVSG